MRLPQTITLDSSTHKPHSTTRSRVWQNSLSLVAWLTVAMSIDMAHPEPLATPQARTHPKAGQVLLKTSGGFEPAIHLESELEIQISGPLASVSLLQRFRNNTDTWAEGVYVFPLPETAAVNYMHLQIGERTIVGTIAERNSAQHIYRQAKSQGKIAGLTEQERPNLFTQSIANIGPGETITVEIHYLHKVDYLDGAFNLHFPMTLTPRYIPGIRSLSQLDETPVFEQAGSGWGVPTHQVPDARRITPPQTSGKHAPLHNPIAINIILDAGLPLENVTSLHHPIRVLREATRYHVQLDANRVPMDRDFRLRWRPRASDQPLAALFNETVDGEHYALAMLLPPPAGAGSPTLPRDVVFVIDTSGSMQGSSITQAKSSLRLALTRLHSSDTFNIIEFDSRFSSLFPEPVHATPRNIASAQSFVRALRADNGTEMAPALAEALRNDSPRGYIKQVVFITDGAVGNEAYLFELIHSRLRDARLFMVGIGSAPNSYFMRKAARFGRGTFTYIASGEEVTERMSSLFEKLESPLMTGLAIDWPTALEIWPKRLPDLYRGEPLVLVAKLQNGTGTLKINGNAGRQVWQRAITPLQGTRHPGISTLWAREKISALLDEKITGRDRVLVRNEVLEVALRHRLLSPYTSLVAVEQTPTRETHEPLETIDIPNNTPVGQRVLTYPRTATIGPLQQVLGAVGLLGWLLMSWRAIRTRKFA